MKKFCIILGSIVGVFVVLTYLAFLFVLPNAIDLNQYKTLVQDSVKEQIPLNIDFQNAKITTTPLLAVGIKADDLSVKFEDGTTLFSADNAKFRISLPSLLFLTINVSTAEIDNPKLNFTIVDGKQFKTLMLVEDLIRKQEEAKTEDAAVEQAFDASFIKFKIPNLKLKNYEVKITDDKSSHYLRLKGDLLSLGYFNGKTAKLKTNAQFYSDERKNIVANIDIDTFLPPSSKLDEEDDKPERVEIPFLNPVLTYREYNLRSDVNAKLKIREKDGLVKLKGYLNIDKTTLKLADYNLPECFFHGKFNGTSGYVNTIISVAKDENLSLNGSYDYGKNKKLDMLLDTDKIYFQDLIILAKAYLDSLHIKNDLNLISGTGYLKADANIKTDLQKLVSGGLILIRNGGIINKNLKLGITDTNADILLEDNNLVIKDTYTHINNALLKAEGKIDDKSVADIKIYANKIPVTGLYRAFAPNDIKKNISVTDGYLTLDAQLKEKLKEIVCKAKVNLENFTLVDKNNSFRVINDDLEIILNSDSKINKNTVSIINKGLNFILPKTNSTIKNKILKVDIDGTKLTLNPADVFINNTSKITFDGVIDSDKEAPVFVIKGQGNLFANDLKKFAGSQSEKFIDAKGQIPLELNVNGDTKRQNLELRLHANSQNYISPIVLTKTYAKDTIFQAKVNFKGDRLKIKETGLYIRSEVSDEEGNVTEKLDEVFGVNGTIANLNSTPFINVVRVNIPEELSGKFVGFKDSGFNVGGKIHIFGNCDAPRMKGKFTVKDFYVRDLLTSLDTLVLDFKDRLLNVNVKNLLLNGSDISSEMNIDLTPSDVTKITNLNVNSKDIDVDKMMLVATAASRIFPAGDASSEQASSIPVSVNQSSIDLKHIKTGDINLSDTTAGIVLYKNNLYINNLQTKAFSGNLDGRISMNLLNNMLKINLNGNNINTERMLKDTAGMKDTLSGKLAFETDLQIDAAANDFNSQMKSLFGKLNFTVKDGQFGPFGKLENMILAENIRDSQLFQTAIGGMISGLTSIDTTHYKELRGTLSFDDGIVNIYPITSEGNVLTLHVAGNYDLLKNTTDMKVRARLASMVANVLGPLANVNPVNLVKVTPGLNVASAKMFSLFTQQVTPEELNEIPNFGTKTDNMNSTNFQIIVRGDVNKPMSLVKSFKWLALQSQIDSAKYFVSTLPDPDSLDATVADMEAKQAEEAKTSTKIKNIFFKKDKKLEEEKILETKLELEKIQQSDNNE